MDRKEYLEVLHQQVRQNLYYYSEDNLITKPEAGHEEEWNEELEILELIEELLEEEESNNFHIYTSMFKLRNNKEETCHTDLAYLENREKGISCYLTIDKFDEKDNPKYMLVLNLHERNNFDHKYENIYTRDINKESFTDRETLKNEMQSALDTFEKFVEADKKSDRFYSKYYDDKEAEEFE